MILNGSLIRRVMLSHFLPSYRRASFVCLRSSSRTWPTTADVVQSKLNGGVVVQKCRAIDVCRSLQTTSLAAYSETRGLSYGFVYRLTVDPPLSRTAPGRSAPNAVVPPRVLGRFVPM